MAVYSYVAVDPQGKETKGTMEVESGGELRLRLKTDGLILMNFEEVTRLQKGLELDFGTLPKSRDFSVFCRQFVSMTQAGVTILETLKMLGDQTQNKKLAEAINNTRISVEKGETLANSMRAERAVFPDLLINMVAAGEATGALEVAFDRMAVQFEKDARMKALLKKAMVYPIMVGIVAVGVIVMMLVFVIPNYVTMFDDLGVELPAVTQMVVAASNFFVSFWPLIGGITVGAIIALRYYAKTDSGKHLFGELVLKLPIFGDLALKNSCARYARTMSTMLAAGIALDEAVDITAGTMGNAVMEDTLRHCKAEILQGVPISQPLEKSGRFPPMVYQMTKIGEETGDMEGLLTKLAEYYEDETEIATESLMAALEPLIIIVLAGVVGFLVMAVMSPMMAMYEGLDNL